MKRFVWLLLILFVSVWLGAKIVSDPGYVLIAYNHTTIELPLWLALILSLLIFIVTYTLIRLWRNTYSLPKKLHDWRLRRHYRNNQRLMHIGLLALANGNSRQAEKSFLKAIHDNPLAWFNYLLAALAAQQQQALDRNDFYLKQAVAIMPAAEVAVGICQSRFQLIQQQTELALANLESLSQQAPRQPYILQQLVKLYVELKDWKNLIYLLPKLHSYKALPEHEFEQVAEQAYQGLLTDTAKKYNLKTLQDLWRQIPRKQCKKPAVIDAYVQGLCLHHRNEDAEILLRKTLAKTWHSDLVLAYGLIVTNNITKQLATAEDWLEENPHDPDLLLTLARICVRNQLWGKAKNYFSDSIRYKPHPASYQEFGKLLEQLGEESAAMECYKKGLSLKI